MNGQKFSPVQLQQELQEKLQLVQKLDSLRIEMAVLGKQLNKMLKNLPAGFWATFSQECNSTQQWLTEVSPIEDQYNVESGLTVLREIHARQIQMITVGRDYLKSIQLILIPNADIMGRELAERLAITNQQLLQQHNVLQLWCGKKTFAKWQKILVRANELLETRDYSTLKTILNELQNELQEKGHWASAQEEKHQLRLYLLKILRQVGTELGFTEQGAPLFEKTGDRSSHIILLVNIPDNAHIDFYLTLEGLLASFSNMDDEHCQIQLDTLSQQLEEKFGIMTHFGSVEDNIEPVVH